MRPGARWAGRKLVVNTITEVFAHKCYVSPGFEIGPAENVIDVGANIGIFAMWAAPQVPQGRIVCVEPSPACQILQANIDSNQLGNVTVVEAAAGRDGGELELVYYPDSTVMTHAIGFKQALGQRLALKMARSQRITRPTVSLGRLMDDYSLFRVHLIKIDCEGGEYELFRNVTAKDWQRIDRVVMEFHEFANDQRHEELVDVLRKNGFEVNVVCNWLQRQSKVGYIWAKRPVASSM